MEKNEAPVANNWLPALLDKFNEGIDEKTKSEIIRLLHICLKHLSRDKQKDIRMYITAIKVKMAWLANFFCEVLLNQGLTLEKAKLIKNMDGVEELFHDISGLSALKNWLNAQSNGQQILKESGRQDLFEKLWNLKINKDSIIFDDLKSLEEKIKALWLWLKIVKFLIDRSQTYDRVALTSVFGQNLIWNKKKIMTAFLISNTLEISIKEFNLKESLF